MLNINREKCTGCGACVQRCPKRCIAWEKGEFGFLYPSIDAAMCVQCGLCEQVCPIEKKVPIPKNQRVYAAIHRSPDILARSTSGGAFTALAQAIFQFSGVVYGAAMSDAMQVMHIRTETTAELDALRGSKYVQSDTGSTYVQAERDLKEGRSVLYSGTPCQIDGLKRFLQKDYVNLYTVDIVCHGVGSQAYFDQYIGYARARYGQIEALRFRSKEYAGWSCGGVVVVVGTSDARQIKPYRDYDNYYYSYFLSGEIYRKSCYSCKYANTQRVGDFSLGDYWGVEALHLPLATENGCSLLMVNSEKGQALLDTISDLDKVETTIEQATHCNMQLNAPSKLPESRKKRMAEYETLSAEEIQRAYVDCNRAKVFKGWLKSLVPYKMKLKMRALRK